MLGLAFGALNSVVNVTKAAKPVPQIPCQAVSVYPADVYPGGIPFNGLTHSVPGTIVGGGSAIAWDWYWEATIQLTSDNPNPVPRIVRL